MKFPVAHCHPSQSCPFWGCHRHMVMSVQLTQIVSSSQVAGPQSPASGEEHLGPLCLFSACNHMPTSAHKTAEEGVEVARSLFSWKTHISTFQLNQIILLLEKLA